MRGQHVYVTQYHGRLKGKNLSALMFMRTEGKTGDSLFALQCLGVVLAMSVHAISCEQHWGRINEAQSFVLRQHSAAPAYLYSPSPQISARDSALGCCLTICRCIMCMASSCSHCQASLQTCEQADLSQSVSQSVSQAGNVMGDISIATKSTSRNILRYTLSTVHTC